MELAKRIVLEIASASQRVIDAATEYASQRGFKNVQACHFRLEKEMQRISVASESMVGVLNKSSLPGGPPLDDRLEEWFSSHELPTCLDTLNQMARTLQNDTWVNTIFKFMNPLRSSPLEDKIDVVIKLFDSRRGYFHFLLATDIWDCEELRRQPQTPAREMGLVVEPVPKASVDRAVETDWDNAVVPPSTTNKVMVIKEEETREMSNSRKMEDILSWLDGLSCIAKQEETFSLRQPDTCTWFNSTSKYKSWRNDDNSFLWLQGKRAIHAGSGKTVLVSFVIDLLRKDCQTGQSLVFFYCDFRDDRSTNPTSVMRSLLSQLLQCILDGNMDPGGVVESLVRERADGSHILGHVKRLADLVSQTAKQFHLQPLVIIDAMDECKDVQKLLDGLLILSKGGMRLLVTSRPLEIIKDGLRGFSSISMDKMTSAVSADIVLHVTRELDSRRRLRDLELSIKTEIRAILCDRADGMFRWVQCQVDTLNQCATKSEIREALNNLPIGLDETYRRILVAIDTASPMGKLALRALVWLVGALRPLRLVDIYEALTLDLERRTMNPDMGPMHKTTLLEACSSLVTYNEDTDIFILSHFSVKEYLTGDLTQINLPQYHINFQGSHERLARSCLCYITLYLRFLHGSTDSTSLSRNLRTIDGRSQETIEQRSNNPPAVMPQELLGYIFAEGFNHLAYLGLANRAVLKDMITLQSDIQRHPDAWDMVCRMSQSHGLPIPWPDRDHDFVLYILIAFASDSLLHAYLGPVQNKVKPKDRTNPLVYAAHFGKLQHAHALLSHGAGVNEKGLVIDKSHQAFPLRVAISRQHDTMVEFLLSAGSIVPTGAFARSTDRNFPIRILRRLSETDEFVEWAMEPGNRLPSLVGLLERRLSLGYESDIISIIRRFIQVGVDPAVPNPDRKTAFHSAIEGGYHAVVLYLLLIGVPLPPDFVSTTSSITRSERISIVRSIVSTGVDVHVDGTEDTALHLIMRFLGEGECLEAVKVLINAGHKPHARNAAQKTPLHLALEQGYLSVASYLLSQEGTLSDVLSTRQKVETPPAQISRGGDACSIVDYGEVETLLAPIGGGEDVHDVVDCGKVETLPASISREKDVHDIMDYEEGKTQRALISTMDNLQNMADYQHKLLYWAVSSPDEHQGLKMARRFNPGRTTFMHSTHGMTLLHVALNRQFPLLTEFLLSMWDSPPFQVLRAILQSALPAGWRTQMICSLVQKGADMRGLNSCDGHALLQVTVLSLEEAQTLRVAKLLVGAGCDISACSEHGQPALRIATRKKFVSVVAYILSLNLGPLPDDILFSVFELPYGNLGGMPLPPSRVFGERALYPGGTEEVLHLLIQKGANVHVRSADESSLLHIAIRSAWWILLPHSERDHTNDNGNTTLFSIVTILVDSGCDPSQCDDDGLPPVYFAIRTGHIDVVEYLLPRTVPLSGRLWLAVDAASVDVRDTLERLLENHGADSRTSLISYTSSIE